MLNELLRINVVIILAFVLYRLCLSKNTSLVFRRLYLLSAITLVPGVMWITDFRTDNMVAGTVLLPEVTLQNRPENPGETGVFSFSLYLIYQMGVWITATIFLVKTGVLIWRFSRKKFRRSGSYFIHTGQADTAPCSFFRWIILPSVAGHAENRMYALHEKTHSRQWHSLDIILFEIVRILLWFNPVLYFIRRELITVHEGLADRGACENPITYSRLIVENSFYSRSLSLHHSFIQSFHIKRRLMMLQEKPTLRQTLLRALVLIPMLACAAYFDLSAQSVTKNTPEDASIEKYPEFPGGYEKFNEFLVKNIQYPTAAKDAGLEGKVVVSFVVTKEGKVTQVKVLRSVSRELDAEAVRVVSLSPDWIAGTKNGTATDVEMSIPVSFKIK